MVCFQKLTCLALATSSRLRYLIDSLREHSQEQAGVIDTTSCEAVHLPEFSKLGLLSRYLWRDCLPEVLGAPLKFLLAVDGSPESMAGFDYAAQPNIKDLSTCPKLTMENRYWMCLLEWIN